MFLRLLRTPTDRFWGCFLSVSCPNTPKRTHGPEWIRKCPNSVRPWFMRHWIVSKSGRIHPFEISPKFSMENVFLDPRVSGIYFKLAELGDLTRTNSVTEFTKHFRFAITTGGIWPTETHQIQKRIKFSMENVYLDPRFSGIYFKLPELGDLARTNSVTELDTFFLIFAQSAFRDGPDLVGVRQSTQRRDRSLFQC